MRFSIWTLSMSVLIHVLTLLFTQLPLFPPSNDRLFTFVSTLRRSIFSFATRLMLYVFLSASNIFFFLSSHPFAIYLHSITLKFLLSAFKLAHMRFTPFLLALSTLAATFFSQNTLAKRMQTKAALKQRTQGMKVHGPHFLSSFSSFHNFKYLNCTISIFS